MIATTTQKPQHRHKFFAFSLQEVEIAVRQVLSGKTQLASSDAPLDCFLTEVRKGLDNPFNALDLACELEEEFDIEITDREFDLLFVERRTWLDQLLCLLGESNPTTVANLSRFIYDKIQAA